MTQEEFEKIKDIQEALTPVNVAAVQLGANNMNLLAADAVLSLTIDTLAKKENNTIAQALAENLVVRYVQRRNTPILQLMAYLNGGFLYVSEAHPIPEGKYYISHSSKEYSIFLHVAEGFISHVRSQ